MDTDRPLTIVIDTFYIDNFGNPSKTPLKIPLEETCSYCTGSGEDVMGRVGNRDCKFCSDGFAPTHTGKKFLKFATLHIELKET